MQESLPRSVMQRCIHKTPPLQAKTQSHLLLGGIYAEWKERLPAENRERLRKPSGRGLGLLRKL